MPTYEYECKSCTYAFETFQSMSEPPLTSCPQCGKEVRRLINGGSGIIFKGSGFYVTDKKGSGGSSTGSANSSAKPAWDSHPSSGSTEIAKTETNSSVGERSGVEKKAAG